jgi:hypothetical protein
MNICKGDKVMKINGRRTAVIAILATVCLLLAVNGYAPAHKAVKAAPERGMRLAEPVPTPTVMKKDTTISRKNGPDVTTSKKGSDVTTDKKGPTFSLAPGISGTIKIVRAKVNLQCSDITVTAGRKWATASGDFSKGECHYALNNLPTGTAVTLRIPKPKRFADRCFFSNFVAAEATTSLKEGERKNINLTISYIDCTEVH